MQKNSIILEKHLEKASSTQANNDKILIALVLQKIQETCDIATKQKASEVAI